MDIDEYLNKKKELEKKKEILEAKNELDKKKLDIPKKGIEIRRRREITPLENDSGDEPRSSSRRSYRDEYPSRHNENIKWAFLGLALFVAFIVVGFFYMSNYIVVQTSTKSEESSDVEALQKQIEELQKTIEGSTEENSEEDSNASEDSENETEEYTGPGPDFMVTLIDEHKDEESYGIFDETGKVLGKIIELWTGASNTATYKYRLLIENKENTNIQCTIDELIEIDADQDGEIDETKYDNKLAVLELGGSEEEIILRSITAAGLIKGEYEAACYFCQDNQCDAILEGGETKESAIFKVLIHTQFYGNQSNSTD